MITLFSANATFSSKQTNGSFTSMYNYAQFSLMVKVDQKKKKNTKKQKKKQQQKQTLK